MGDFQVSSPKSIENTFATTSNVPYHDKTLVKNVCWTNSVAKPLKISESKSKWKSKQFGKKLEVGALYAKNNNANVSSNEKSDGSKSTRNVFVPIKTDITINNQEDAKGMPSVIFKHNQESSPSYLKSKAKTIIILEEMAVIAIALEKVLIRGGYFNLKRPNVGIVPRTNARFYDYTCICKVRPKFSNTLVKRRYEFVFGGTKKPLVFANMKKRNDGSRVKHKWKSKL
ncbi:hypothetical protein L1987_54729 [Smallanthus sonchifolius]|uniref:Uncharacterized protein n=1 Tax=Smallanthus sonchifolius TaxID=185202 RepID=A0ACB9E7X9_9ASTR|nr:hypothetical protein L1987_54729 [Smallanthus sonchifolius]